MKLSCTSCFFTGLNLPVISPSGGLLLLSILPSTVRADVYWRSEATSGYWVDSSENRWYRNTDGWLIQREDLAVGQYATGGTKSYNILHFDNANQTTMTVNGLGGTGHQIAQILLENNSDRTFAQTDSAYLQMGGGTGNAKIEAVGGSGTGTYTFDVPLTLEKTTELNPQGGNLIFNLNITNAGNSIEVNGSSTKSLTIAGAISGNGGITVKNNTSLVLSGTNAYSGATSVNAGKLVVNGSIGSSAVTVNNTGSILASDTLATIGSSLKVNAGAILAVGDSGADGIATVNGTTKFNNDSVFSWDISSNGTSYDKLVATNLLGEDTTGDAVFRIVAADSSFSDGFWSANRTWTDIFTTNGTNTISNWTNLFGISVVNSNFSAITPTNGSFSFSGNTLTWSAVPEPTSALAGILLGAGLLRRRRAVTRD